MLKPSRCISSGKASCRGERDPTSWFHHFAFSLYLPMLKKLSVFRIHHPPCNFFFCFISTPGNCLWEAFLWRKACGNRIRGLYAWWQGIGRQDKTSTYISGIHESTGRSVSVEKWYLSSSWSSNSIGWKLQWTNPVPVYFVFVIFGLRYTPGLNLKIFTAKE